MFRPLSVLAIGLLCAGAAHATIAKRLPSCDWDSPGHNPFMGDVVAAVDHYPDIPADVRQKLKLRMSERRYDDMVTIRRDAIVGRDEYGPQIREMHFGEGSVCGQISRSGWTQDMRERGLVYCESGHCILVPTVCRNVSRIDRLPARRVAEAPPAAPAAPAPSSGSGELAYEPPGAGQSLPATPPPTTTFVELAAPVVPTGVGEGMTPMAGPGSSWAATPPPAWGPSWADGSRPGGDPGFPGFVRDAVGGLPPLVLNPGTPHLPPPPIIDDGYPPPPAVNPVPEPETWALLLAGLLFVGSVAHRRRKSAAAA